jgi:dolichol-phosphate mannosyltransferase
MPKKYLTALPVFNEVQHVDAVLDEVLRYSAEVLVVDDGSTDGTAELLAGRKDIRVVRHPVNKGYGAALNSAFQYTLEHGFDVLVTIDCDGQHEPQRIPHFVAASDNAQIVSGSRYLERFDADSQPPEQRRRINAQITAEINQCLGLQLTDAFCGFKAYRADALTKLKVTEPGYAMPLEVWVQAAKAGLTIVELPVPLIYLDESRSFGGALDDGAKRLEYYHTVIQRSLARFEHTPKSHLGRGSLCGKTA